MSQIQSFPFIDQSLPAHFASLPYSGGLVSAALTSGLNTIGQMRYSGVDYTFGDYFNGFVSSATLGAISALAFNDIFKNSPFFRNLTFYQKNFISFLGAFADARASFVSRACFCWYFAWRSFIANMAAGFFGIPFSQAGERVFSQSDTPPWDQEHSPW